MFGSKDHLGFTEDDLDRSLDVTRRRALLGQADLATRYFRIAVAISVVPMVLAVLVQTLRSDLANRWTTFWIVLAILLAIVAALELFIVRKQRRAARRSVEPT